MRTACLLIATVILAAGCGSATAAVGSVEETSLVPEEEKGPGEIAAPVCTEESYSIPRGELNALLAKGPADLLASVQTDSHKENGRFVGFRIVSFRIDIHPCLDLREEDVVTRVNGETIERPEQYFAVFEKLKAATEVRFDILRAGEPITITYPVN